MKVLSIFGTRPEMIKMWATLKKLDEHNFDHVMVHTGQNFTPELKEFFFNDLEMRKPDFDLGIDVSSYANEVSSVIKKTDEVMEKVQPDALLILGDTYSGLSIMPASYRGIKTFHMEAGLRAYDRRMPEQRNRILKEDPTVTGFNIGINDGPDAGRSVHHLHIHLIPRRSGDMENPRGGVRGVIPEKQKYVKKNEII